MKTIILIFVIVSWLMSRNKKLKTDMSQNHSLAQSFSLDNLTSKFNATPNYSRPTYSEPKLASNSGLNVGQVLLLLLFLVTLFIYLEATNVTHFINNQDKNTIRTSIEDSFSTNNK